MRRLRRQSWIKLEDEFATVELRGHATFYLTLSRIVDIALTPKATMYLFDSVAIGSRFLVSQRLAGRLAGWDRLPT